MSAPHYSDATANAFLLGFVVGLCVLGIAYALAQLIAAPSRTLRDKWYSRGLSDGLYEGYASTMRAMGKPVLPRSEFKSLQWP